jgi:hypothetical protein
MLVVVAMDPTKNSSELDDAVGEHDKVPGARRFIIMATKICLA